MSGSDWQPLLLPMLFSLFFAPFIVSSFSLKQIPSTNINGNGNVNTGPVKMDAEDVKLVMKQLLDLYDEKQIDRLELEEKLSKAITHEGLTNQAGDEKDLQAIIFDHITIRVPDVVSTSNFYQQVFEMPLRRVVEEPEGELTHYLQVGNAFFGIQESPKGSKAFVDHFCIGLKNFNSDKIAKRLSDNGFDLSGPRYLHHLIIYHKINIYRNNDTVRFVDGDGFHIQLCTEGYADIQMNVGNPISE